MGKDDPQNFQPSIFEGLKIDENIEIYFGNISGNVNSPESFRKIYFSSKLAFSITLCDGLKVNAISIFYYGMTQNFPPSIFGGIKIYQKSEIFFR